MTSKQLFSASEKLGYVKGTLLSVQRAALAEALDFEGVTEAVHGVDFVLELLRAELEVAT